MSETKGPPPPDWDDSTPLPDHILALARPAREVLPEIFAPEIAAELLKPRRGRPPEPVTKESISLRLDPGLVAAWRASGKGWQTRMAAVLSKHKPVPKSA